MWLVGNIGGRWTVGLMILEVFSNPFLTRKNIQDIFLVNQQKKKSNVLQNLLIISKRNLSSRFERVHLLGKELVIRIQKCNCSK